MHSASSHGDYHEHQQEEYLIGATNTYDARNV